MLLRHLEEYNTATHMCIQKSKLDSLKLLIQHGFKKIFAQSLTADGLLFKSKEEHARFAFCKLTS